VLGSDKLELRFAHDRNCRINCAHILRRTRWNHTIGAEGAADAELDATDTPVEIVEKLNREINAAVVDPKIKAQIANLGGTVLPGSPADFAKLIVDETDKWGKVIKFAGIKAE
jgi:Tripartite tricarboxylate transporter family receptor